MPPCFTSAEVAEAERPLDPGVPARIAVDPFPLNAPDDVWAVDQADKVTLCMLAAMRGINAELARFQVGDAVQHAKNRALVAEDYLADLRKRDVVGAIKRANANMAARMAAIRAAVVEVAEAKECE